MSNSAATIPIAEYLFRRLASLGIQHIFGVPGDFNLTLLDHIYHVPKLQWLGCCNELNAAYAADGYARIKGTPAALVTTYGVGELSAMNGVAGAYAEHAGMIHIVGMTARKVQENRLMIHHTLEPQFDHATYIGMSEPIRKTYTFLTDDSTMAQEVDRVIVEGVRSKLPVYIYVPTDAVTVKVDASRLETPLDTEIRNSGPEDKVVSKVLAMMRESSNPAILADVLATRHNGRDLTRKLAKLSHFPSYATALSKGIIDETSPWYGGVYNGKVSFPGVCESVENSDFVLNIGPLLSDSNTGGFTRNIEEKHLALLGHDYCIVGGEKFDGIHFLPVLKRIVDELERQPGKYKLPRNDLKNRIETPKLNIATSGPITQDFVWQRLGRFLKPHDIILGEAGTAQFGLPDATFPEDTRWITQIYWSSIGFTVGACLGACVAAKELKLPGRVVLVVGEGSLQMTVQELASYIRFGFKPIIFVINNGGYTIERAIHGPRQGYNDVSMLLDHQKMLEFFGAREETGIKSTSISCKTVEELERVLGDESFGHDDHIKLCEIFMSKYDYPWRLSRQLEIAFGKPPEKIVE